MMTEFGGAVAVPNAVRSSDSTTTILVNEVIMIRIDGAIDSTVRSAISWIARSVTPPLPCPRLMLISCASAGAASDPAAISVAKNKTLRGTFAGLTKGSLGGPAMTPSRLRDFQNRSSVRQPAGPSIARCGLDGRAAVPVLPAEQPCHRQAGEVLLPAVAPSPRDFGPPSTGPASAAAWWRVRAREPGAPLALRSDAPDGAWPARCAMSPATASVRRAARGGVPAGRRGDC